MSAVQLRDSASASQRALLATIAVFALLLTSFAIALLSLGGSTEELSRAAKHIAIAPPTGQDAAGLIQPANALVMVAEREGTAWPQGTEAMDPPRRTESVRDQESYSPPTLIALGPRSSGLPLFAEPAVLSDQVELIPATTSLPASRTEPTRQVLDLLSSDVFKSESGDATVPTPGFARDLDRAEALIALGDFSGARLLLSRPAELGHARAIFLLARTYDPKYVPARRYGMLSDEAKADELYRRAKAVGVEPPNSHPAALPRPPDLQREEKSKKTTIVTKAGRKPDPLGSPTERQPGTIRPQKDAVSPTTVAVGTSIAP